MKLVFCVSCMECRISNKAESSSMIYRLNHLIAHNNEIQLNAVIISSEKSNRIQKVSNFCFIWNSYEKWHKKNQTKKGFVCILMAQDYVHFEHSSSKCNVYYFWKSQCSHLSSVLCSVCIGMHFSHSSVVMNAYKLCAIKVETRNSK